MSISLELKFLIFEDILSHKNISVDLDFTSPFEVSMSPLLVDILLNNIISNAIRHNFTNGTLFAGSDGNFLRISNTGNELKTGPERLFERFKKESSGADSVGLGLAIVKQICDNYDLAIEYNYQQTIHTISIRRNEK